jgi:hypothetical protein
MEEERDGATQRRTTQAAAPDWKEIEPYLDEVLDAAEADRPGMLALLAVERPFIAAAVRYFLGLRDEAAASSFLEGTAVVTERSMIGMQVGTYTISALLGRGGMGQVWLARRSDGRFEGQVAVKFLDSYATSPLAIERFRREGRLLARLTHPHIARLVDAGVTSQERPYLVLEYVDGEQIDRYCDARSSSIEERLRLVLDVLAAVMHAHSNLVVHRDIKPSNVLVAADGSVKVLDFGIAKLLSNDPASGDTAPTRVEDSALTPDYAAPEQILGEAASTATDVYQLGVLLFVLLAGRLPFDSTQTTRAERVKIALDVEPPRLSEVAPRELRKRLRGDLDAIVDKALRKLPQERYPTAAALADDVRRYLNFEPVAAREGALGYRARKFARRYRAAVLGSSLAILALLGTTAFALLQMREAQAQRDYSRNQEMRAHRQAEFTGLMMSTVGTTPVTADKLLDAGANLLEKGYADDPAFQADSYMNLAGRYGDIGQEQKVRLFSQKAAALAHQLHDVSLIARSECELSAEDADRGDMDAALKHLAAGREALANVAPSDFLAHADCLENQAAVAKIQGDTPQAINLGNQAIATLERAGATHDVRYSALLGDVSIYYNIAGDKRTAFAYVERALAAAQRNGLGDTDSAIAQLHNLAVGLYGYGEVKQAGDAERELIARLEASGRTTRTTMAGLYSVCLLRLAKTQDALLWADRAVKDADQADVLQLRINGRIIRSRVLLELKRFADAAADMASIESLSASNETALRGRMSLLAVARARFMAAQGRLDDAARLIEELVATLQTHPEGTDQLPGVLKVNADIALAQHRFPVAADLAQRSLALYKARARDADHSADVGEAALLVAQARTALHDVQGSREAARQAAVSLAYGLGEDNPLTQGALALR